MYEPVRGDRAAGGHQRLPRHLAAEHPLALLVGTAAPEDVHLDGFEVEDLDELVQCGGHDRIVAASPRDSVRRVTTISFPDGFVWGTATAAHQVEGGNWNNDWWAWEHAEGTPCTEVSGDACDHYHRYRDDVALLAELGFNAYRFSLEWSRIEPEDGEFSRAELDHYRRVCAACHEHGITPVVTFHHFTTPRWVAAGGGGKHPATAALFARFCERATAHLGDTIGWACTINEPNMVATIGYLAGSFPPGRRGDSDARRRVNAVFIDAHRKGAAPIRSGPGDAPVGLTLAMQEFAPVD